MNTLTEQSKIRLLGAASLVLGVVCVFLFYEQGLGVNYPLFVGLVVAFGLLLAETFSRRLEQGHYAVIGTGVFFSFMVFVRSSELLTFYNILGSVLLLLIAVSIFQGKPLQSFFLIDYAKVLFLPFRFIAPFFEIFPAIVSIKTSSRSERRREIVRGSFMAIIALIVFASLFASADARFEKLLENIFTFKINQDVISQTFFGAFVTAFFVGAFGFMFKKIHAKEAVSEQTNARNLGATETAILLNSINVLFFIFILLQISSLFGGTSHLLAQGLTYAQYAREGFFQLVVVAVLSFLVILFSEKQIIQNDGIHLRSFKIHSGVLVLQVIAILVSAFTRLSLYENAYGFTEVRLYSHAFMIWIGVVLVLLSFHIWKSGKSTHFYFYTFWTIAGLLFMMNVINPDVFIAKKNLARYQTTGQLDAAYLGYLSDDALPYTIRLLDDPNEETRKSFAHALYWKKNSCGECDNIREHTWKSNRLNRSKAEKLLSLRQNVLEENKTYEEALP
jgi:hypothetical protein